MVHKSIVSATQIVLIHDILYTSASVYRWLTGRKVTTCQNGLVTFQAVRDLEYAASEGNRISERLSIKANEANDTHEDFQLRKSALDLAVPYK